MSRKEYKKAEIQQYIEYVKAENEKAERGEPYNSGARGRLFEALIKYDLGTYNFNGMAARSGLVDIKKTINEKMRSIEAKTGAGELGTISPDGKKSIPLLKKYGIIYAPEFDINLPACRQAYFLTPKEFWNILEECGLIRYKTSSSVTRAAKQGLIEKYYDRIAIQTFTNSAKKIDQFYDLLEEYATPFLQWAKDNNILENEL